MLVDSGAKTSRCLIICGQKKKLGYIGFHFVWCINFTIMNLNIKKIRSKLKTNILTSEKLHNFSREREEIYHLIKQTVDHGESNSVLLIGPRGIGKTTVKY